MKLMLAGLVVALNLWSGAAVAQACVEEVLDFRREYMEWEKAAQVILESEGLPTDSKREGLEFLQHQLTRLEDKLYAFDEETRVKDDECLVYAHSLYQDLNGLIEAVIEGSAI